MKLHEIIGQGRAKSRINFHVTGAAAGEPVPTMCFVGPRGFGKTELATATGVALKEASAGIKRCFVINAASIKNLKQFFTSIIIPRVSDRDVTLVIDEASELPQDVTMALLSMLNPNAHGHNSYTYDEYTVDIDSRRQTFLFATTEGDQIFPPLMSRCRRIDLEPYTYDELGQILQAHAKDVEFEAGLLGNIAPVLRGEPRQATLLASEIKSFLAPYQTTQFNTADWKELSRVLDILPYGLTRLEVQVLRVLEKSKDVSLTRLAANMGMSPESVRKDIELHLLRRGFLEIHPGGRNITSLGQGYLKALQS